MQVAAAISVLLALTTSERSPVPGDRPSLGTVADIRRLSPSESGRGHPVRLQATVTFHHPTYGWLFVHDGKEGIFVVPPEGLNRIASGSVVAIDGKTGLGEFAPVIEADTIAFVKAGALPAARRLTYADLAGGRADSQWVEVEAVVRGIAGPLDPEPGRIDLRIGAGKATAHFAAGTPTEFPALVGATVRLRAACGSTFNNRRQWDGVVLYIPSIEEVTVVRPPPADFSRLPLRSVASLKLFDPDRGVGEPVRLNGTIILRRGDDLLVQDETGGVAVSLRRGHLGEFGDRVEVFGFLARNGAAWVLEDGQTGRIEVSDLRPRDVTPEEAATGQFGDTLVRTEATLVDRFALGMRDLVCLMRSEENASGPAVLFSVLIPDGRLDPVLDDLRPGSRVRVTGACIVPTERHLITSFRVFIPRAAALEVVAQPPWWTRSRILAVAGGLLTLALAAGGWVVTLRRRLRRQTIHIRERLEREADLEARYRELVETASDVVFTLDPAGRITSINDAGRRLTGLGPGDHFIAEAADAPLDLTDCESPVIREARLTGPDGPIYLEVNVRPIVHDEAIVGVQAIARDLTHRRRLEAGLRHASKMEAIGRLAGGVAHDFNNLLTVINGNAEVLRTRLPNAEADLAEEIVLAGGQAAALTRQLLAFSRKGVVAPKVLCPNDVIQRLHPVLNRLVGERIDLVTVLDADVGNVKVDPGLMDQAILNLVVNGRDAMPAGGRLTIRTRAWIGHVRVEVSDTGHGIDEETLGRMFEPFFTTKPVGEGTGLGLATVKSIVEHAGGHISVRSRAGEGTTFLLDLPLCDDFSATVDSAPTSTPVAENREVILLVEDEPAVQLLERRVLESGKYEVLVASSGEEALALLDEHAGRIDLLVTDVVMPGMSGRELAEVAAKRQPGLPALFLSGYTPDEVLRQGIEAAAAHFLQKPFSPGSLLTKVREVLSRPMGRTSDGDSLDGPEETVAHSVCPTPPALPRPPAST
jgi:signal transduction histidine kinase/CheY-like chemotaxis protein